MFYTCIKGWDSTYVSPESLSISIAATESSIFKHSRSERAISRTVVDITIIEN